MNQYQKEARIDAEKDTDPYRQKHEAYRKEVEAVNRACKIAALFVLLSLFTIVGLTIIIIHILSTH